MFFLLGSQAQSREIGILLGGSNYHGDLAHDIVLSETHASAGIFYRYNFNEYWAYRPTVSYMRISGSDENFEEHRLRNLSFRSTIYEWANTLEFNYQPFSTNNWHQTSTFYAFAGVAMAYHNPQALYNGEWHDLWGLNTEGQEGGDIYQLFQFAIPFGAGYKHAVTPNFIVAAEIGWRKTFTDYLDDVSTTYPAIAQGSTSTRDFLSDRSPEVSENGQRVFGAGDMRGDPNLKDWYIQTGITLSYRFTPIQCPF